MSSSDEKTNKPEVKEVAVPTKAGEFDGDHVKVKSGMTSGRTFEVTITPRGGRPTLIAVHL